MLLWKIVSNETKFSLVLAMSLFIVINVNFEFVIKNYPWKNLLIFLFLFVFCLFRAVPVAYGGSQARGQIGAVAPGLHHSHGNTASELQLQPTQQLAVMRDP